MHLSSSFTLRLPQCLLIGSFLPLCWLLMMAAHEAGHAVAALTSGGTVTKVVLHPLAISRTDVDPNSHPLLVVWGGPIGGVAIPLAFWLIVKLRVSRHEYLPRFWVGFCLIANGAYIGIGSFDAIGDAREMLLLKTPIWSLWLFGVVTIPVGFVLWNGIGPSFGLGPSKGIVDQQAATCSVIAFVVVTVLLLLLSPTA